MPPVPVIEDLDVLRDLTLGLLSRVVVPVVHQLILQCAPETLHRSVVIAVTLPTHGRGQAELPQLRLIGLGTILRAAIRMMNEPRGWPFGVERVPEGPLHQARHHSRSHGIPDDFAGEHILDASEIQPAFRSWHIRDVGDPGLIRSCGSKCLGQDMLRHRQRVRRIRGGRKPADLCATLSHFLTEPFDSSNPREEPIFTQFRLKTLRPMGLPGAHRRGLDGHFQTCVLLGALRGAACSPGIVPTSGYLQHPTQHPQRILETQRPHERVPGSCAFATYAVAFFRMSRSMRVSARSRLSRDTSTSSSVTGRRLSLSVASRPRRARHTQRSSVLLDMVRRLAASGIVTCCSSPDNSRLVTKKSHRVSNLCYRSGVQALL